MSSLRNFRFQKNKASTPSSNNSSIVSENDLSSASAINSVANGNGHSHDDSNDSIHPPFGKRPRLNGSESESGSPLKISNGYGYGGMPSPDVVQSRLDLLSHAFPNKDRMDLQDTLKSCNFDCQVAMDKIREGIKSGQTAPSCLQSSPASSSSGQLVLKYSTRPPATTIISTRALGIRCSFFNNWRLPISSRLSEVPHICLTAGANDVLQSSH